MAAKLQSILREAGESEGVVVSISGGRAQRERVIRTPTVALSETLTDRAEHLRLRSQLMSSYKLKGASVHLEPGKV